ncbi:YdcF family protein [Ancylobacter sp. G4_0304]|uniref:YdcF family protein n=1 Tax=Ancylobacter sp. G4_0304 TaxID=3114289 RepID=UPI0039C72901
MPEPLSTSSSVARRRPARLLAIGISLVLAAAVLAALGFVLFILQIRNYRPELPPKADGIVALTGGADRVVDATNLLIGERARRLLITGVHPDTTLAEIGRTVPAAREVLDCCVDLGHSALNTRGNGIETAEWVHRSGFRSVIVVTSAWHMPRALVELQRAMPEVELVPYPVVTERMRREPWWSGFGTGRVLFIEYVKYVAAYLGISPWTAVSTDRQLGAK